MSIYLLKTRLQRAIVAGSLVAIAGTAAAAPQPLEHFARMPQMRDVVISPDGRYVAFISALDNGSAIMTFDRQTNGQFQRVAVSEPGKFDVDHCAWANNERIVCSLVGNIRGKKYAETPFVRTMAVDANGANIKTLEKIAEKGNLFVGKTTPRNLAPGMNGRVNNSLVNIPGVSDFSFTSAGGGGASRSYESASGQRRDQIVDVTPDDRDSILIQAADDEDIYPSVFALNVYNGLRAVKVHDSPPIRQFLGDGGAVRFGWGTTARLNTSYFVRSGDKWKELEKLASFTRTRPLLPIGIEPGGTVAYAVGDHEGRMSLWGLDLSDQRDPEMLLTHEKVDLGTPILSGDKRLIGIRYEVDRPFVHYTDEKLRTVMNQLNALYAPRFHMIVDMTADRKTLVIRTFSDVDEATYYLYDTDDKKLKRLGNAYPELATDSIGTMKHITYKAADGTDIPGYLTVPRGVPAEKLPLIVMPHDGPGTRDTMQFFFLRNFLANRGYAVLQMNYRGSAGYGQKWRNDANGKWGELTYSDIADATRWAVAEGIADPKRVCIAGWGFGGYAALLGAARNADLYKCAISIAGFTDLEMLMDHASMLGAVEEARLVRQIGDDRAKLNRDSPLRQASAIGIPVLLVHGDLDWQVQVDHAKKLASELEGQKKPHKAVFIKGAGHDLDRKSDRLTLLREVEQFLQAHLAAGT